MTLTVNETNGDDTQNWNSTDRNLNLDGKEGSDTLNVYASDTNHVLNLSENGRYEAVIADQTDGHKVTTYSVETINYHGLGGDTINIADMTYSGVEQINLDLTGGNNTINVNGTAGADNISLSIEDGNLIIDGLSARIVIEHYSQDDTLTIHGLGGDDVIAAFNLSDAGPHLTLDGGAGNDTLLGSFGSETILGGSGNDTIFGGPGGNDVIDGGAGHNTIIQPIPDIAASVDQLNQQHV